MLRRLLRPTTAPFVCFALVLGGLIIDLTTDPALVVAIIYNVPIVVSAAVLSRTLTVWTIVASLAANLAAGWVNAVAAGEVDDAVVVNRSAAAATFLIVGAMTLLFETRDDDVRALRGAERDTERAALVRELTIDLLAPLDENELLTAAAERLRVAMAADAVVISGLAGDRFAPPRWAAPFSASIAEPNSLASWAVHALPVTATPVITLRDGSGATTVGRLVGTGPDDDLIVLVRRSNRLDSSRLLGDALSILGPLRARSAEVGTLRSAAGGAQRSDAVRPL